MQKILKLWEEKPLLLIFWIAFLMRIFSSVFSQGFLWEDISEYIEIAKNTFNGFDKYNIFPHHQNIPVAGDRNLFVVLFHYLVFELISFIKITDAKAILLFFKILYSLVSLVTVYYSYLFSKSLTEKKIAKYVSLVIAVFWLIPFLSSKTFSFTLSLPFLFSGLYFFSKFKKSLQSIHYLIAGISFGLSAAFNFSIIFFLLPFGLIFVFKNNLINSIHIILGFIVSFFLTSGLTDFVIWGQPFIFFFNYVINTITIFNFNNNQLSTSFLYLILSSFGIFLIFIIVGIYNSFRQYYIYIIPLLLYFLFLNFPAKDINYNSLLLTPLFVVFGIIGFWKFIEKSNSIFLKKSLKWIYISGIVLNFSLFIFFSTTYYNKAFSEACYYIGNNIDNEDNILIISNYTNDYPDFFYNKKINKYLYVSETENQNLKYSSEKINNNTRLIYSLQYFNDIKIDVKYIIIIGNEMNKENFDLIKKYFPLSVLDKDFKSKYIDKILNNSAKYKPEIYVYLNE